MICPDDNKTEVQVEIDLKNVNVQMTEDHTNVVQLLWENPIIKKTFRMKKNGKGVIVNIGSFAWMRNIGGMICYTTAKSAISGLTRSLARELGSYNIRVNCVVPGWIMTERQKKLWLTPEIEKNTLDRQCIKRLLHPNDISKTVLFFASDQSSGISAQNYVVDGGIAV